MNESPHTCPDCGAPLPAGSPQALCPACLMRQALASRTIDGDGPAAAPPPAPEEIAGKFPQFEILECLGRGGMGVVSKARQKSLNRLVAIKILAPEREHDSRFAGHFAREAELLARLSHPHIVTIHDFGEAGGLFYLVMEFVDGVNLRDLLRDGKLEPEQALAIVPPVCEALQYAHDKGIVHRDIKPENLLLDRDGRIKIADFGIAALMGADSEMAGTPPYMAPEQQRGSVDRRTDIYALGVVLYEMLTGERPTADVVAPSKKVQIDVRLDEVVLRALEKEPELRFQDASGFKTQVETICAGVKGVAPAKSEVVPDERSPTRTRGAGRTGRTKSALLGRVALGLFLAAVVAGISLWDAIHETFLMASVAVIAMLASIMGIMSWSTRPGKFTAVASGLWLVGWLVFTIGFFSPWGSLHQFTGQSLYPRLQVPKGYGGYVVVAFGQPGYPELPIRGEHQILRFPEDGILITSAVPRFGGGADHAIESYDLETGASQRSRLASHGETGGTRDTEDGIHFGYSVWEVGGDRYWQGENAGSYLEKLDDVERRLRARVTEGKEADSDTANPSFGPVIERVVPDFAAGRACLLDLDSGEFLTPPDDLADKMKRNTTEKADLKRETMQWLRESHVDVSANASANTVCFISAITRGYSNSTGRLGFDDFTPTTVSRALSGSFIKPERKAEVYGSILPAGTGDFAFITSEGTMGVMEVLEGPADASGVKIRYKILRGVKPSEEALAAAKVVLDLPPLEPVKELKLPTGDLPDKTSRQGYRLTVEPREGDYILATIREYEGYQVIGGDTPAIRQVIRLLRTQSVAHSEDIFLDCRWAQRPSVENPEINTVSTNRCVLSGFGQQVVVTGLDYSGASGGSAQLGAVGDKQRSASARRRFRFSDFNGDAARTRIVEFAVRVIREDEAESLTKGYGISLPDDNVANWAVTLSAPVAALSGDAASPPSSTERTVRITIGADGVISVRGRATPVDQLKSRFEELSLGPADSAKIHADRNVPYKAVIEVMDACRGVGIERISLRESPDPEKDDR